MQIKKVTQTCSKPTHNLNPLNQLCPQGIRRTQAWEKQMTCQARLRAYCPRHLMLHQVWKEKQIRRKMFNLNVTQNCRKPPQNLNPLIQLCPQGRRRTQAWENQMNCQARLRAYWPRPLMLHQVWKEKEIQRKMLVLKVTQTCSKPPHNLNPLIQLFLKGWRRTQDWEKQMTCQARLRAYCLRPLMLYQVRREKQIQRKMLVLKVAHNCSKPLQNSNPLNLVFTPERKRTHSWWKHMLKPARLMLNKSRHLNLHRGR